MTCPALTGGVFSDRRPVPAHEHFLRWGNSSPPTPRKNFYYIRCMLHIIVIVTFIGVAIVCHMIGTKNTIHREKPPRSLAIDATPPPQKHCSTGSDGTPPYDGDHLRRGTRARHRDARCYP